ncbi:hypothetical protein EV213_13221 [Aureibacillus halotolerans]|uniref:Uncharacterized protein n=1 Tax=Aureibacillus halotolerans TaxID=1508390 RepID=A0A4R6TLX4_9BACI|nr:hypothetical protein EV213_13221 [Aureibacillus halotolerans]
MNDGAMKLFIGVCVLFGGFLLAAIIYIALLYFGVIRYN